MLRHRRRLLWIAVLLLQCSWMTAGTPGSFRGTLVNSDDAPLDSNWIYIQARNGAIRRVNIAHASVEYGEDVPRDQRNQKAINQLRPGTEVRVTAEQGSDGEWRANRVEILKTAEAREGPEKLRKSWVELPTLTTVPELRQLIVQQPRVSRTSTYTSIRSLHDCAARTKR